MIAHRTSNFLLTAMGAALLTAGAAWAAAPPDNGGSAGQESAGSADTTPAAAQAVDQAGNIVTQPPTELAVKTERATQADTGIAEPAPVVENDAEVVAETAAGIDNGASPVIEAPILDAASSQLSFQALLTDALGDPLAGPTVSLVFNIWDTSGVPFVIEGPIGPFVVPITNGIVDTLVPVTPKFFDGTARELGVSVDAGVELSPRVKLAAVPYALRVDRVRSAELDDVIELGAVDSDGSLSVWSNLRNIRTIRAFGSTANIKVVGDDGLTSVDIFGRSAGSLQLYDLTGNDLTALLTAGTNSGGLLRLRDAGGVTSIEVSGGTGIIDATDGFRIKNAIPGIELMRAFATASGAQIRFKDELGVLALQGGTSTGDGGLMNYFQADGGLGVRVAGDAGTNAGGVVNVFDALSNATIELDGQGHQLALMTDSGVDRIRMFGSSSGLADLSDSGGDRTARLYAGPTFIFGATGPGNDFGGQLSLSQSNGTAAIFINGGNDLGVGTRIATTGSHEVLSSIATAATVYASLSSTANGGQLKVRDEVGVTALDSGAASAGGFLNLFQKDGGLGVEIDGDATNNDGGGVITIRALDGSLTVLLDGESGGAGLIQVRDSVSQTRVFLDGESVGTGGEVSVMDGSGTETIELLGSELSSGEGSAQIMLRNSVGGQRIELDADTGSGSRIQMFAIDGGTGIVMDSDVNGGGRIRVRNKSNISRIFIDGDYANTGLSRIRADVFRVQGGVDLAEPFECKDTHKIKPGMVMSIDPDSPGKLMMSTEPYDRKVAGIVSGAGGVRPGITLSQEGVMEDGHLVALTGRVYCKAVASNGAIRPGDLLTTSGTPGHAMKVSDPSKAHGAVIGKAMTSLDSGTGLVLVLVQPQ